MVTAWCGTKSLNLFGVFAITSEQSAYIVMVCDFLVTLVMFFSAVYLKEVILLSGKEIEDVIVNAADFTVRINCEPDANQSRDELRAAYWIWIHDLMKADPLELKEPIDKQVDRF